MEAFDIRNLSFTYPNRMNKALDDINLTVNKGDFVVICGYSGSGKSTLLRSLKPCLSPTGTFSGEIYFDGRLLSSLSAEEVSSKIGFVMQSPDSQTVTDKVWHELAFSLESLGCDNETIRKRVAETAAFFGLESLYYRDVYSLSGGQKQLLALASVMTLKPDVIILDEPTSQLDPIAAAEFLSVLSKINRETGTTVIIAEHRLEEVVVYADKVCVMKKGRIIFDGSPKDVSFALKVNNSDMLEAMPVPVRVWASLENDKPCPLSVNEGRAFLSEYASSHTHKELKAEPYTPKGEVAINAENVWMRYEKTGPDVLRGLDFTAYKGEIFSVLGSNGSGKTTSLKVLAGLKKQLRGDIKLNGKAVYMPQQVETLFSHNTVLEDLYEAVAARKLGEEESRKLIAETASLCRITDILLSHPYDISGGEQQKAALAKLLLFSPDILLLDEPTKGLDAPFKTVFGRILCELKACGKCIVLVSHDVEFCAKFSDRCGLFFDGSLVSVSHTHSFFLGNSFYTTSADRISRGIIDGAITVNDIKEAFGVVDNITEVTEEKKQTENIILPDIKNKTKLSPLRKAAAALSLVSAFALLIYSSINTELMNLVSGQGMTKEGTVQLIIYGAFLLLLLFLAVAVSPKNKKTEIMNVKNKEKLPKRTVVSSAVSLVLIPVTLLVGFGFLPSKQYYITAVLVILECMLPFLFVFEGRKPKAKEISVLAVLCAVAVAGRAAFFMLPQFKPVAAVVIVTGAVLGAQSGFLVGSVSMLVSNMLFSQGPWTPWQMFAMGLLGFVSGILSKRGVLSKNRMSLCVYGLIATYVIYGGIVNASSALMLSGQSMSLSVFLGYYVSGFPMDTVHALSTVVFLWFGAEPLIAILTRIKIKYALEL